MLATFLGTSDGHTSSDRSHSGIVIRDAGLSLLLDCGANTAQYFLKHSFSPDAPSALWLSHMHSDHVGQFPSLIQSLWLRSRKAPLTIFAPADLVPAMQKHLASCLLFPELIGFPLDWQPVFPKSSYRYQHLTLQPFPTSHLSWLRKRYTKDYPNTCFDCYGAIIESKNERLIYSADLGAAQDLLPHLKKPTKTLICEWTHLPEKDLLSALSKAKPVGQTLFTHYPDQNSSRQSYLRKLADSCQFFSKIRLVKDGQTISL